MEMGSSRDVVEREARLRHIARSPWQDEKHGNDRAVCHAPRDHEPEARPYRQCGHGRRTHAGQRGTALSAGLGRKPTDGDLYMAHVLGASGPLKLIGASATTPQAIAANLLPEAAQANRSIFYSGQGTARSASQVYAFLASQQNVALPASAAALSVSPASTSTIALATQDPQPNSAASEPAPPLFQSLFQDKGRGAVSPRRRARKRGSSVTIWSPPKQFSTIMLPSLWRRRSRWQGR
jgi:hypothetical protein